MAHRRGGRSRVTRRLAGILAALALSLGLWAARGLGAILTMPGPVAWVGQTETGAGEVATTGGQAAGTWGWDAAAAPDYVMQAGSGQVDDTLAPGEVRYGGLDALGRTLAVKACVTKAMVDEGTARERGDISDIRPSGWPEDNEEVTIEMPDGRAYHGWLFNRSHLLAKSLGGKDEAENLVTGTRTQNVGANDGKGGIAACETMVRDWLAQNPEGHVWYDATPQYEGDELVPRAVTVDLRSSDGTLDGRYVTYNAAKGYEIDYSDGSWSKL